MAENKGIFKLRGLIAGLSFYEQNGKHIISVKKGPSKEQVLHDARFIRSRENMKEFGGASVAGKAFRRGFSELIRLTGDSYISGRLTGIMKHVISKGIGERGKRKLSASNVVNFFRDFEFSRKQVFSFVFSAPYPPLHIEPSKKNVSWTIPSFDTNAFIQSPEGSTHFKLILSYCILSDHVYDELSDKYIALHKDAGRIKTLCMSKEIPLGGSTEAIQLSIDAGYEAELPSGAVVLVATGIRFLQEIHSEFYDLTDGNAGRLAMTELC